jgi:hypothetical protein
MTEDSNRCPKCGGEAVPIVYGLVPFIPDGPRPEILEAKDRGELVLGGCVVDPGSRDSRSPNRLRQVALQLWPVRGTIPHNWLLPR